MYLLIGGDSEIGSATYRHLRRSGHAVQATTRRRNAVSPDRPFFDILHSLDEWQLPRDSDAVCVFLAVARLRDCAADPVGSANVNITQTLRLLDRLIAEGVYTLFLSSNQVFDGDTPNVPADHPFRPLSEYGRQKIQAEAAILERMAKGAPLGILRISKALSPDYQLFQDWIEALLSGEPFQAFDDMTFAPVPIGLAVRAVTALLEDKKPGVFQLSGPRDVTYAEVGRHFAKELGVSPDLIQPVSAYSAGMPEGSTPQNTTLDSTLLRERYGVTVPDVWETLVPVLETGKSRFAHRHLPGAKLIKMGDLSKVAEGVYYSRYPLPLVNAEVIEFLKQVASTSPLRRARFCAHPSPDAEQHDMLIVSHRDTYVTPHRHLSNSETFVVLEGIVDIILFDESGGVEKTVKMGTPDSGLPFFYRMPPRQFHSLAIKSDLLVFLENTRGPFDLDDREHASWAPDYNDQENGKAFIDTILRDAGKF